MPIENQEDTTLSEDLAAAFKEVESSNEEQKVEGRARDESGKFVAKEGETEVEAAARLQPKKEEPAKEEGTPKTEEQTAQPLLTADKAPSGWGPAAREKWGTIPEDIRKEILRREEASVVGVRQLQERYSPLENFFKPLEPFAMEARQLGADAGQYIAQTMATERVLRTADVPTKFQTILQIADQYGVPLRDIINQSVGAEVLGKASPQNGQQFNIPPSVQAELEASRKWREDFEAARVNNEIAAFANGKEFFDDVHMTMATLMETGQATTLQDAYDSACWAVPSVREVLLQRQAAGKKTEELKGQQKAAAGASVKPNGSLDVKADDDEDDDLGDTVRKAWTSSNTGRV